MSGFTTDEIRAFVAEFEALPHGSKTAWLRAQPFSEGMFRRWRASVFAGDLDRGLVPRHAGAMPRSKDERDALMRQRREMERMQARIDELERANDALGKAIGLLHAMREPEPDEPNVTETPADKPPSS